jgi:hypothetical protein
MGAIVEPNQKRISVEGQESVEASQGSGKILIRGPHTKYETKDIMLVEQALFIGFDFLPNAALLRRECLEEQMSDSHYMTTAIFISYAGSAQTVISPCP